jgi:hypothetical protein
MVTCDHVDHSKDWLKENFLDVISMLKKRMMKIKGLD